MKIRNFVFAILLVSSLFIFAKAQQIEQVRCTHWQAEIDETLGKSLPKYVDVEKLSEQETFEAIECLLKLEGNKNEASFSGALKTYISTVPQSTAVEVSALFYISYLYYKKFDHADMVALVDDSSEYNSPEAVKEAYKSYRKWFEEVKKVGLEKARAQKLDPLSSTKVKWF